MNYDDIVEARRMARKDGVTPTQLHLGDEEYVDLINDADFRDNASPPGRTQLSVAGGIDVRRANADGMRVLLAQSNDEPVYYIF